MSNIAAMEQTRMLANTLAQNADPKFQVHPLLLTVQFILHNILQSSTLLFMTLKIESSIIFFFTLLN